MKSTVPVLLALLLNLAMTCADQRAEAADLTFALYALGMPVAESAMHVDMAETGYSIGFHYHTTGIGRLFSGDRLDQETTGLLERGMPNPAEFREFVRLHGQDRNVTLDYRNGTPSVAAISPPNATEREDVPNAQLLHAIDPLSTVAAMLSVAARTGRCDISDHTYDGRRLEVFQAHTAGEEDVPASSRSRFAGRALRCDYSTQTVAGFRHDDGRDEDARPRMGTIWLARAIPGGPLVPVHGMVDMRFLGAATMYLTTVTP